MMNDSIKKDDKSKEVEAMLTEHTKTSSEITMEDVLEMDRRDEEQILKFMEGRIAEEYFYRFKQGGAYVQGISIAGIREWVNRNKNIVVSEPKWEDSGDTFYAWCSATNTKFNVTLWGSAAQSKLIFLKEYDDEGHRKTMPDPYAFTKALSKAQRNAIRQIMPETLINALAEAYFSEKARQHAKPIAEYQAATTPATLTKQAQAKAAKAKTLAKLHRLGYDEDALLSWAQQTDNISAGRVTNIESLDDLSLAAWRIAWIEIDTDEFAKVAAVTKSKTITPSQTVFDITKDSASEDSEAEKIKNEGEK